jgi:hypothetical protein
MKPEDKASLKTVLVMLVLMTVGLVGVECSKMIGSAEMDQRKLFGVEGKHWSYILIGDVLTFTTPVNGTATSYKVEVTKEFIRRGNAGVLDRIIINYKDHGNTIRLRWQVPTIPRLERGGIIWCSEIE